MSDFTAIDALLAGAPDPTPLPPAERRRQLRDEIGLSRAEVARALGVSPSTLGGWETGRDPSGKLREQYAYFLTQAEEKIRARVPVAEASAAEAEPTASPAPEADGDEDQAELAEPQPCVLCGQPARFEVAGYPQHLDPAECSTPAPAAEAAPAAPAPAEPSTPARKSRTAPGHRPARRDAGGGGVRVAPVGRRVQTADVPDPISTAVAEALAKHSGDIEAATNALVKRAIPDAMALLDGTRKGGRYDIVAHPWLPDILHKQSARGSDQVWEARPKWTRPELPQGAHKVTALDINGAYLSALKTWLPLGKLEHTNGGHLDRRRAGFYLITPPEWDHSAVLPNPLGSRDEPGPVWIGEPTLRQLLRLAEKYRLCDPPEIHESWTSGATESLLEKFRIMLKDARDRAIAEDDDVTGDYVKAMYSKFVSTLGESNFNREIYRTDWMHLIRSQAFANLWMKAFKAYDEGLTLVRAMGTDELHVIGDWRAVFPEGRGVAEVKVKDVYTVGADDET
ncbi:helix-turn-helix domain-containing protein [Streptomyces scabiei]|uniref:helix-turn-helix domain-containing protein n=1 Tax=Streptomyces scabiei TaxID=1930 RepID=UPI0029A9A1F1|nr:helix-turn-helix transcriptional regulator [Streptomyces scabiei]MDX2802317.1 helix-turn-helix transcriptional regulator [Streptomyces scabiei]MDX3277246.1 helix-turn-helix transcriptional regulator [Streptomyces scabiei]